MTLLRHRIPQKAVIFLESLAKAPVCTHHRYGRYERSRLENSSRKSSAFRSHQRRAPSGSLLDLKTRNILGRCVATLPRGHFSNRGPCSIESRSSGSPRSQSKRRALQGRSLTCEQRGPQSCWLSRREHSLRCHRQPSCSKARRVTALDCSRGWLLDFDRPTRLRSSHSSKFDLQASSRHLGCRSC